MSSLPCDCAAETEGKWTDIHSGGCAIFKCGVCGKGAFVSPPGDATTYCVDCCPDHEYEYQPGEGKRCKTCNAEPPADYYADDFDC